MKTILIALISLVASAGTSHAATPEKVPILIHKYCVHCHGEEDQSGDIRLDHLASADAELLTSIYQQLSSRVMPPDNESQPTAEERNRMAGHFLELAQQSTSVSTAGLRRLNKREYNQTLRDLLGLDEGIFEPGRFVYGQEIEAGFDTEARELVISNELLLEYMNAAQESLRQALFTSSATMPESNVINIKTKKMKGGSSRYETKSKDSYIFRVGGNNKIASGEPNKLLRIPGRYRITVTASAIDENEYPVKFTPINEAPTLAIGVVPGNRSGISELGKTVASYPLAYNREQTFQVETFIDRDYYPYLRFANGPGKPITQIRSGIRRRKLPKSAMNKPFRGPGIKITQFQIEGPYYDSWPPKPIRVTYSSDSMPNLSDATARAYLLGRFATRAFRRRVSRKEIEPWYAYSQKQYDATGDWREAVVKTMTGMLTSPDFLYLLEEEGQLSAFPLASRLSYFFWSSMPDHELFLAANSGKLSDPAELRAQVVRLIQDPRSDRLCESFVDQWLSLDKLGTMPPDSKSREFREYNASLEQSMRNETRQFFRYIFRQNRSVGDFIDCNYAIVNSRLAKLYGIPFEADKAFDFDRNLAPDKAFDSEKTWALAKLPPTARRGGLLGQASVLTLTSNGVETSPVTRGVWVLSEMLGTPPPPPPEEVPALVPDLNGANSVRELLEKHRSDSACMECHRRMDPLGFALESYDPIGRLRTRYSKRQKVDTTGTFMRQDFKNIEELKEILSSDLRPFARNLVVRIAEYAKGRRLVATDYTTVESILDRTEKDRFRLKSLVAYIATSDLMTNK
ncbi:DUF1592 domain-containing protein [Neorhodopirellula lusitana]|uniref:DUF1592 domain-containing protein n=1 Tax=Neorhodopirellula lusitana TaxID=445327 RepID=UPI00384BAC5B